MVYQSIQATQGGENQEKCIPQQPEPELPTRGSEQDMAFRFDPGEDIGGVVIPFRGRGPWQSSGAWVVHVIAHEDGYRSCGIEDGLFKPTGCSLQSAVSFGPGIAIPKSGGVGLIEGQGTGKQHVPKGKLLG